MFSESDKEFLCRKGMSEGQVEAQLECFRKGFPYLSLVAAASIGNGILKIENNDCDAILHSWDEYLTSGKDILKFVPASGAASRMFKDLFEFMDGTNDVPTTNFEKKFFLEIEKFAFFNALNEICLKSVNKTITELISEGQYKTVVHYLLTAEGLNYGNLPKGLLQFHNYKDGVRTAVEEHLVEGALYANANNKVKIHFTISPEHRTLFETLVNEKKAFYEQQFKVIYTITFSEQKQSTDTVAATTDNQPFRDDKGEIVFRPGGHGALIENLNDLSSDIIFIKNIDNVVPDHFKVDTIKYKKVIAGLLVQIQKKIFNYLDMLDKGEYSDNDLLEMIHFLHDQLQIRNPEMKNMEDSELALYIKAKLNRPIRVCGMVKNEGEPGGGPFIVINMEGSTSLQILESSQINVNEPTNKAMFEQGTHFNPVDLVCGVKDFKGNKFNLPNYVDSATGFISSKSKNGKELKALELPGLWNGAMADWNTLFVEVSASTFNPVKTVNDLLRIQHQ